MKKVFITGGAGFIGANVAAYYLEKGDRVTIFDSLYRPGVENNITWLKSKFNKSKLRTVKGDIRDYSTLKKSIKGSDLIFHFAGQTAVTTSIKNPREDFEINALGTFNVLESMREIAPKAVMLYSSTNKVYGQVGRVNTNRRGNRYYTVESANIDESEPLDFYSPYGTSKGAGDQYTRDYARIYGLKTIVFRQSCIYGTHQFGLEDQGWVAHFVSQVIKGNQITIFGDGRQVRDMLYVSDFAKACDKAVSNIKVTAGEIYNMGGGIENTMSLLELIAFLKKLSGKTMKPKFGEARAGDQKVYISDIAKARRDFDWKPEVGVEEGVERLYNWLSEFLTKK
jgi:CDP-paratose 2-epimerase